MSFVEARLNDAEIIYETVGGPAWLTTVSPVVSGFEQRNVAWPYPRGRWELGERVLNRAELDVLIQWFNAMQGRGYGFRWKDWADFAASLTTGILGTGVGNGGSTYQCYKRYSIGSRVVDRVIKKLVSGTLEAYRNGVAITGESFDVNTGIATLPALLSLGITAITQANPGVVTTPVAHGLSTGDLIALAGIGGMTQLNGTLPTITVVTPNTFSVGINTTSYGTYTSGGTASKYPQPADTLRWAGEFDVPARFDTDELRTQFTAMNGSESLHFLSSLPVIEIRLP